MNHLTVETEYTFSSLLELAANNDVDGFKISIERDPSGVHEAGPWYERRKGSKQMINEQRTPLMVAATYGSIDIIRLILSSSDADVNFSCGSDKSTALHCAASGGAVNSVDVVKLLLAAGADSNLADANDHYPFYVIVVPPNIKGCRRILEDLLATDCPVDECGLRVSITNSNSPSLENGSPRKLKFNTEKKEYPIDPSLPDIQNSIYSTDEFRMYSFKVRPCSRAYSHDWTECPFVHPGENARRRDPRKFHYSCVPCPDFRKGACCRRQDMCEYAHGVFESWLHPAQYRTRLCKDGTSCARRVCFFAHTHEELRPLYVPTGSAVPSPRSMEFAAAMSLFPGSPSAFTPPMSPSTNGSVPWSQPNVPALHLPGTNFQSSCLRSSINARDIPVEDLNMLTEYDMQILNEFSTLTPQPSFGSNSLNRSGRLKALTPSNLDDLFTAESLSPRYSDQAALHTAVFSPTHKSAVLNQFQFQFQQQQSMLSPINTNFGSSGRMSPRNVEQISPMSSRVSLLAAQREKQQFRSLSSRELGSSSAAVVGSPVNSRFKWGVSNGRPDWAVSTDELGKLRRSNSFGLGNGEEPDLSWVQSLVKESTMDKLGLPVSGVSATATSGENPQIESMDRAMLGAWLEQLRLDQRVVQQN